MTNYTPIVNMCLSAMTHSCFFSQQELREFVRFIVIHKSKACGISISQDSYGIVHEELVKVIGKLECTNPFNGMKDVFYFHPECEITTNKPTMEMNNG
jgi:hypothetical protein